MKKQLPDGIGDTIAGADRTCFCNPVYYAQQKACPGLKKNEIRVTGSPVRILTDLNKRVFKK
jgi:hypothetical protein